MARINVSLTDEVLELLDRRQGRSRSAKVASAIEEAAKASPAKMAEDIAALALARGQLREDELDQFKRSAARIIKGDP